jgi:hypothetical protein
VDENGINILLKNYMKIYDNIPVIQNIFKTVLKLIKGDKWSIFENFDSVISLIMVIYK